MAYSPTNWQNTPATTTAVNATNLNKLEAGVQTTAATADNAAQALALLTTEYFQDLVAGMLRAGTNVSLNYDDNGGLLTISATGGGSSSSVTVAGISDATAIGKAILLDASASAVLGRIGGQPVGDYATNAGVLAAISTQRAAPNGLASLGSDGKLPVAQLPELAITRAFPVASQAAMLALTNAQTGDVAVRTDVAENYILNADPASTLSNWQKLAGAVGQVASVNGQVGAVVLTKASFGLDQVDNTSDANKPVSTAQGNAIGLRVLNVGGTVPALYYTATLPAADAAAISALQAAGVPANTIVFVGSVS